MSIGWTVLEYPHKYVAVFSEREGLWMDQETWKVDDILHRNKVNTEISSFRFLYVYDCVISTDQCMQLCN